ncbi:tropomyosin beta chain-like [Montipora foliosa]|uniref:tropomyosin beta chain-like n=1 Tax=Montipora foliosa TaxID=591990 RepID=UPI0035F134C7
MAGTDIVIDGEQFNLVSIPNAGSKLVQTAKGHLLGSLDLQSLVEDLGKLGNFIRVAYNGVAGHTEVQIKVQRVGYKITKLADKSAVTVHKFKGASQSVLEELKGTYEYLLDGLEEMALETLSQLTSIAKDMAAAADELHNDFEKATKDVIDALEDTQRAKGSEEERKKALEEERKEFELKKQKAVMQQKHATEAEQRAKAFYDEAQKRENKAIDAQDSLLNTITGALTGIVSAVQSVATLEIDKAVEKITSIGDKSGHKEAMKMANEEKKKQMEEMQKQRDLRQEALLQCLEFAEKIKNCQDDGELAEAAIKALHSSIGALKSLSAIMMKAAIFWQQMQVHCESLATGEMQNQVERAMKMPEEKRIKVWTSNAFKGKALRYYSKWVALDDVCGVYMLQIKETRQDLYNYLEDNPTIEEARKNVRELAATFGKDLKEAQEKLEKENMKALEAKKELENSDN